MSNEDDDGTKNKASRTHHAALLYQTSETKRRNIPTAREVRPDFSDIQATVSNIAIILHRSEHGLGNHRIGLDSGFDTAIARSSADFYDALNILIKKYVPDEQAAIFKVSTGNSSVGEAFRDAVMYGYLAEALGHPDHADAMVALRMGELSRYNLADHFTRDYPQEALLTTAQELAQTLFEKTPGLLKDTIALGKAMQRNPLRP